MKKEVWFLYLFVLLFSISFASCSVSINNYSLKDSYSSMETISGWINLTILGEDGSSKFTYSIDNNQSITLKSFLDLNLASYFCLPSNCNFKSYDYNPSSSNKNKVIILEDNKTEKMFGFVVFGKNIRISSLSFNVSSNYTLSDEIPLRFNISEKKLIEKDLQTNDYTEPRLFTFGCFNSSNLEGQTFGIDSTSTYCEKISLPRTNSVRMGFLFTNQSIAADKAVIMTLKESNGNAIKYCNINIPRLNNSCDVNVSIASSGDYYICLSAKENTDYLLYSDNVGINCGWYNSINGNSSRDYSLFAAVSKYAAANLSTINLGDSISNLNLFIQERYNGDCTNGCTLPISVSGVGQELNIDGVRLSYSSDQGSIPLNSNVYSISSSSPKYYFNGTLSLDKTGFSVLNKGNKTLTFYFNNNSLFQKQISVKSAPVINRIDPSNPPAGVLTTFVVDVSSENNVTSYSWDFGDGSAPVRTTLRYTTHMYSQIRDYNITLISFDSKGGNSTKIFSVTSVSPKDYINTSLANKRAELAAITESIKEFPEWYQTKGIKDKLKLDDILLSLDNIQKDYNNAIDDSQFLNLSLSINAINLPYAIVYSETSTIPMFIDSSKINLEYIITYTSDSSIENNKEDYKDALVFWQRSNIGGSITKKVVTAYTEGFPKQDLLTEYSISITSSSDQESYFILQKSASDLFLSSTSAIPRNSEGASVLELAPGDSKTLNFYLEGNPEEIIFYASPKLSTLTIGNKPLSCNNDGICNSDKGENSSNCRNDCKPASLMVILIIVIIIFALVIYTILQIWYKRKYENFLFKDRRELINLVMFITNARVRGMSDIQIRDELRSKGWSSEKIQYAIKKSRGERTGLYELIPIEKIASYFRGMKAKKELNNTNKNVLNPRPPFNR